MFKKILLLVGLLSVATVPAYAYSFRDFIGEVRSDTTELYSEGKIPVIVGSYYDFLAPGAAKTKVLGGISAAAWKFIAVQPAWVFTPDRSNRTGELAVFISLRPGKIPVGGGYDLEDVVNASIKDDIHNLSIGLGGSFSLVDQRDGAENKAGFGVTVFYKL